MRFAACFVTKNCYAWERGAGFGWPDELNGDILISREQ